MGKLIYSMSTSIDGWISRPGGELDWHHMDAELHDFINARQREFGGYLLGRKAYEMMEDYWPTADQDPDAPGYVADYARIWREKPKVVFSSTLQEVQGNARLARDDAHAEIARLKAEPGQDLSIGGPTLAGGVADLIDEFWIFVNPVAIGAGAPLLPGANSTIRLKLVETQTFGLGVIYLRYARAES